MVGAHLADAFVAQRISVAVQLSMAQEAEAAERTTPPRGERERERAQLASERVPVVTRARGVTECVRVCGSNCVTSRCSASRLGYLFLHAPDFKGFSGPAL